MTRKWLAIYTRPRWEKKVNNLLLEKGLESYCPLNKVRRKWSDRVKVVEEPLFKSYVFVKVSDLDRTAVRMTPGAINFVYWNGKPAVIREKEIIAIRKFLDEYENVEAHPVDIKVDQRVRITNGTLMDHEGKVLDVRTKTAKVAIDSLGYILVAYIDRTKLTSVQPVPFDSAQGPALDALTDPDAARGKKAMKDPLLRAAAIKPSK
jgi:transcription antitermination factor NusG